MQISYILTVFVRSVAKSCLTFYDPMDYSPPGSSVHGILQARVLEWVAISSSRGSSPHPGTEPAFSCDSYMAGGSLPTEPPGSPVYYEEEKAFP